MSLEIVYGQSRNENAAQALAQRVESLNMSGTIYLGYPVLTTADEQVEVDALLVSPEHGLVAFLISDTAPPTNQDGWQPYVEAQDRLFGVLESYLGRHANLRERRRLAVEPQTATIFPQVIQNGPEGVEGAFLSLDALPGWLETLDPIDKQYERALQAALQRVATIKPSKKRSKVTGDKSRGAVLKQIESGIANLDFWQKTAAIESPEGPQRIRGLAGSGKTVVLALKAAYWHANNPDWRIAVTFSSRALYQQFEDLLTRFSFEYQNDRFDAEKLSILHSWGSFRKAGVYSSMAQALGVEPLDFLTAKERYGMDMAFQGACRDLLKVANTHADIPALFDAVLIDEAQDLPPEFFQLVYKFTRHPKRIVWGYDELQRLSEAAMPSTDELFGFNAKNESNVSLETPPNSPRRDIVLPICYRNSPWALATAHALGIGVYREGGLLQHPDESSLWSEIGYNVVNGSLTPGSPVFLRRSSGSTPEYFASLMDAHDAVAFHRFENEEAQDQWIAAEIAKNIQVDELEPDDILIVLPDTYRAKSRGPRLRRRLESAGIKAHQIGVTSSVDEMFIAGSVAIANIFRAKGNEAPMVYVADAQYCAGTFNAVTKRNTLFTAITRSRAWVRVCGHQGESKDSALLDRLFAEAEQVRENDYGLRFKVPTPDELRQIRHLHRDRPEEDESAVESSIKDIQKVVRRLKDGTIRLDEIKPELQPLLRQLTQRDES